MTELKITKLNKKFSAMKNNAADWENSWEDIRRWERPTRGRFNESEVKNGAEQNHQDIVNGKIYILVRTFADGMYAGMTNPAIKWFKLELENEELNENNEVRLWLEKAENLIFKIFSKSNFYETLRSLYEELGLFGVAGALINDDFETVIRMRGFTIGEYYFDNDYSGRVNSMAREFVMTVSQVVEEFGLDNASEDTKNKWNVKDFDKNVTVRHCIYPRKEYDDSKKDNLNMPFVSVYWEPNSNIDDNILLESGYKLFPVIAPTWNKTATSDVYSNNSPGWDCLGDAKMIQVEEKDKAINLALIAQTPMLIDASIDDWDLNPNGVTRGDLLTGNNPLVRPVEVVQADVAKIDASIKEIEQRMGEHWYTNFFTMFLDNDDPRRTATEIIKRDNEKMVGLASVLTIINNEALSPSIEITFDKILEGELLEEPPEIMQGSKWKISYISMIAQAQKMIGTGNIEQVAGFVGNMLAVFPDVVDNYDSDEAYRIYADKSGISPKITRSKEAVLDIRLKREQAQKQAQQQEQAAQMVEGAKVLSETEIKPNTALTELTGGA